MNVIWYMFLCDDLYDMHELCIPQSRWSVPSIIAHEKRDLLDV